MPSSDTGGVKAFPIEGRMKNERERLAGMTAEERAWRAQWLKDQVLSKNEPIPVEGYYQARYNPIRRFYRWPLDTFFKPLVPRIGYERAAMYRWFTGKFGMLALGILGTYYYFKYNTNDWTRKGGWRVIHSREEVSSNVASFPRVSPRTEPSDYAARGFKESPI
ncbi:NADH dehydrogenase (ubiquinone) B17 subunit [Oratosquilla oratoria]|uniref:NADH dehydrogenase (ubiquinone) B17 subunit n=1 Tax=Oratosquilla oratoria TaxID=337810 RepID=UPI003F76A82F